MLPRIRALIVDDEVLSRLAVRQALAAHTDIEVVGECGNVPEALQAMAATEPDLLFLDIQMPGSDGFGLLQHLSAASLPLVVFTTAYAEHALKAFDASAIDYVLKPIEQARFDQAVSRARKAWAGFHALLPNAATGAITHDPKHYAKRISVQAGESSLVIPVADIDWLRADDNYVRIHVGGRGYLHRATLRHFQESLDPGHFLRIHRSIMVNMDRVREVQALFPGHAEVVLHDGTRLDLSRRFSARARLSLGLR